MGCDIHLILEAQTNDGSWVAIQASDVINRHRTGPFDLDAYHADPCNRAAGRDYTLFSILSDVRSADSHEDDMLMEYGLPGDSSEWSDDEFADDGDLHSTGWNTLEKIQESIPGIADHDERKAVETWLENLKNAADQALKDNKMFLIPADHDYDEYDLSNHELLELRGRVAREREEMRAKFEGRMPAPDDLSRLRVIIAYDN